ncbi:anhydro-N-acetylmuramic acid kinase [Roseibium aquae]|uniref:Anhydro-N-acetylmuramic acid kinase n=1 Tax=Roseibium aquae TaxID=1323746 RepID=A0A916TL41_9HYPH|nr:anhydro-N-acetylmuramic acid kinase [Roseibium aquae]GGB53527.1 anhydro-N-acetylmuramic acid kinase [Roseibium aquae]
MTEWSVVGCISGTSADGIDIAEIGTDGQTVARIGPSAVAGYRESTRQAVLRAIESGPEDRSGWPALSDDITQDHIAALRGFLSEHGLKPDFIAVHGQTVWHDPDRGETVQLGDPQVIAQALQLPVISDLRLADMAAGGEGAPLVPVYHRALVRRQSGALTEPVCFLNIGGVSNLTYVDGDTLLAFDIGPGNALLDDWVRASGADDFDRDGRFSGAGRIHEDRLAAALSHGFFQKQPPKSLDRNAFSLDFLSGLDLEDGAATLAAFTARAITASAAFLPREPAHWFVCGGGRKNPTILGHLAHQLRGRVDPSERLQIDGDALEAQAMAYLGARHQAGLPTSYPGTTGARLPVIGGTLYRPGP